MESSSVDLPVLFSCSNSCSVPQFGAVRSISSDNCWVTLLPDKGSNRTNFFQDYRLIINFEMCLFFLEKSSLYLRKYRVWQLLEICWLHAKLQGSCKGFFGGIKISFVICVWQDNSLSVTWYMSVLHFMKTWLWTYLRDQSYLPSHKMSDRWTMK